MTTPMETKEDVIEDEEIIVPEKPEFLTIPPGTYKAKLVAFKTTDKPDFKLKGEEGEDKKQWAWTFVIVEGEYEGTRLTDYTNRTWHEKAKAHKHAAALLGVPTLVAGVNVSTRELGGKVGLLWVTEVESKKNPGEFRNYITKVTPLPTPRMRPTRPQATQSARVGGPAVVLPDYPQGDEEEEISF